MFLVLFLLLLFDYPQSISQVTYSCNPKAACGCSTNSAILTKIVGGENAGINTWGWTVSILISDSWICGGTILSSSWLLTAAHCLVDVQQASDVVVSAATNELFGFKQSRNASLVIWHPQYDDKTSVNDIGLIQVSPPFNMTDPGIAQICLPMETDTDFPPINSSLVAIGWGSTVENGDISDTLEQVTLQRISYDSYLCHYYIYNDSMQFCAGVSNGNGGKDTCSGDSGGALMMFTSSHQWIITGIVSYGYGCAKPDTSGLYTRIVYYLDWIQSMNVTGTITAKKNMGSTRVRHIQIEEIIVYLLINIILCHLL